MALLALRSSAARSRNEPSSCLLLQLGNSPVTGLPAGGAVIFDPVKSVRRYSDAVADWSSTAPPAAVGASSIPCLTMVCQAGLQAHDAVENQRGVVCADENAVTR